MSSRIQFRRDTAARWKEINPILLEGELGLESDTLNAKIGDGVHAWKELDYAKVIDNIATSPGGSDNLTLSQKATTELCKGTSTYSNAAEYPQLKIADFSTGITTTGENRRTEILTAFNKWLDGIEFKITSDASKYHGCCKISCDGRNGEVFHYVMSYINNVGCQVLKGPFAVNSNDKKKVVYGDIYSELTRRREGDTWTDWVLV